MKHPAISFPVIIAIAMIIMFSILMYFSERITHQKQTYINQLQIALLSNIKYDTISKPEKIFVQLPATHIHSISTVTFQNQNVALIVRASAKNGYGGAIDFLLVIDKIHQTPSMLHVIEHSETPGITHFLNAIISSQTFDGISHATITINAIKQSIDDIKNWIHLSPHF